jgi:hypothetical protein
MRRLPLFAAGSAAVLVAVVPAVAAQAGGGSGSSSGHSGHHGAEVVDIEDDCHPPSFNRMFGPGTCQRGFDGDTTVTEFLDEVAEDGEVGGWRFHPDDTDIERGQHLLVHNVGGEFHTFTPVRRFGGGCIPPLNAGREPVAECADFDRLAQETGVPAGAEAVVRQTKAVQRYECLIHPWMRAVVEIDD